MSSKPSEKRQVVRFAFYKLDSAWRRLSAERQASSKIEFGEIIESFAGRLLLRPYGLVGIRGDCDFLLWQVAENLDALVALQTALNRTDLGAYLASPYSYVAMTRARSTSSRRTRASRRASSSGRVRPATSSCTRSSRRGRGTCSRSPSARP